MNDIILLPVVAILLTKDKTLYLVLSFGQLGCSGFVVADSDGCFVSRKTMSYLDYGDRAFAYLKKLLVDNFSIHPRDLAVQQDTGSGMATVGNKEQDVMSHGWTLPSVGIKSMDKEHEKCEETLSLLLSAPNAKTLTNCMEALTEHFQHEEILMEANDFGKPNETFSPYANHCKDHERILDIGFRELSKHSKQTSSLLDSSFLAITCSDVSDESGCSSGKNGA